MNIDTPAHIQYQPQIQRGIRVEGGTNYDLSRGAVSTPVVQIVEPEPAPRAVPAVAAAQLILPATAYRAEHGIPETEPRVTLRFAENVAAVSSEDRVELKRVARGQRVYVVGHADPAEKNAKALSERRAKAAARYLPHAKVVKVTGFGAELPLSTNSRFASVNRRVEVISAK